MKSIRRRVVKLSRREVQRERECDGQTARQRAEKGQTEIMGLYKNHRLLLTQNEFHGQTSEFYEFHNHVRTLNS